MMKNSLVIESQLGSNQIEKLVDENTTECEQKIVYRHTYASEFQEEGDHPYENLYLINCSIPRFQPLNCEFIRLRNLNLDNNRIESLESLNLIKMPNISKILLFNNHIISLRPLTKLLHLQNLTELSLSMNPLLEPLTHLSKCDLGSLQQLRLYQTEGSSNDHACITYCAKLNCYFIRELGVAEQLGPFKVRQYLKAKLFRCVK